MKQRLHKILAKASELSLRSAEKAIELGQVTVNGRVVTKLGSFADPGVDIIKWKGVSIGNVLEGKIYLAYHKPKSKLVTKSDPQGRSTIWSDLEMFKKSANAVGRLDYDSEGLLIVTNNGELMNRLTHPKYKVKKVYLVKVKGIPAIDEINQLRNGVSYGGEEYQGAEVRLKSRTKLNAWYEVKVSEGKNRQIRNMFLAIGFPVQKLKRIAVGPVRLGELKAGKFRALTGAELKALFNALELHISKA